MSFTLILVLALVQGLTEFLPVSSSAHLILAGRWAGGADQGPLLDLAVHVGSLLAVIAHFRADIARLAQGAFRAAGGRADPDGRLAFLLMLTSAPVILVGAALAAVDLIETLREPRVIAWASIGFGLLLLAADRLRPAEKGATAFSVRAALFTGLAQACAVIPGASRSGLCVTALRAAGFERREAARLAMLAAIPTIGAAGLYGALSLTAIGDPGLWAAAGAAALASFLAALAGIRFFLWMAARTDLSLFVAYRIALGVLILILV